MGNPRGSVLAHRSYSAMLFASCYQSSGRYDNAEELYKRALIGREEKLGPDYPDTLRTVENLAIIYSDKRRYDDTEELYKRTLAGNEEKLGRDHPDTLRTVENMAICLEYLGRINDADLLLARFGLRETNDAENGAHR